MVKGPLPTERILCDHLSLLMVLIISIVGSIICFQAIPYMNNHEHHYHVRIAPASLLLRHAAFPGGHERAGAFQ